MNLIEVFLFTNKLITQLKDDVVNIFEKGSLCDSNDEIYYKYTKNDKKFIVHNANPIEPNIDAVIEMMIRKIVEAELTQKFQALEYSLNSKDLLSKIIPDKIFGKNSIARNEYFKAMCKIVEEDLSSRMIHDLDIYRFEIVKIRALSKCVDLLERHTPTIVKTLHNDFKLLYLYNKFYVNYDDYILYSKVELHKNTLEDSINTLHTSISQNLDFEFVRNIRKKIIKQKSDFIEMIGDITQFKNVDVNLVHGLKRLKIDGIEFEPSQIEFVIYDGKFEKNELSENELLSLNHEDLYFNNNILIMLPEFYTKSFEIIQGKSDRYDLQTINKDIVIKTECYFDDAVETILLQCNKEIDRVVAESRLINLLRNTENKYHNEVLEVISRHRPILEQELQNFVDILKTKLNQSLTAVIPLKDYDYDKNGLYVILLDKYRSLFDRNTQYAKKLAKSVNEYLKGTEKKNIVFISDVGISGKQVENTFNYYSRENNSQKSQKFYKYAEGAFQSNIQNAESIIFLNCMYTDIYEKRVRKYLKEKFNVDNIFFEGFKIEDMDRYLFNGLHSKTKKTFIEFIKKYYSGLLNKKLPKIEMTYEQYLEICQQDLSIDDDNYSKTLMFLRLKSLPKCHQLLLGGTVFDYRKD